MVAGMRPAGPKESTAGAVDKRPQAKEASQRRPVSGQQEAIGGQAGRQGSSEKPAVRENLKPDASLFKMEETGWKPPAK